MMDHPVTWASPRPLWRGALRPDRAPTILRFSSDEFMDQLFGILATDPAQLGAHVARHETWRTPPGALATTDLVERVPLPAPVKKARLGRVLGRAAEPPSSPEPELEAKLLKLFQPAHQRYYIVGATLACAIPGLPDRSPRGGHEKTGFVVRRLLPRVVPKSPNSGDPELAEFAYVKGTDGGLWQMVSDDGRDDVLVAGEELLPLFPLSHADSQSVRRTMWGGLIPVGRREEYLGVSVSRKVEKLAQGQLNVLRPPSVGKAEVGVFARMTEFKMDVAEPWKAMIRAAQKAAAEIAADPNDDGGAARRSDRIREANLLFQTQSWLLLLDWADYLKRHVPSVYAALSTSSSGPLSAALAPPQARLLAWLRSTSGDSWLGLKNGLKPSTLTYSTSIAGALSAVIGTDDCATVRRRLESVETQYRAAPTDAPHWPAFHFLLAGITSDGVGAPPSIKPDGPYVFANDTQISKEEATAEDPQNPVLIAPALPPIDTFDVNLIDTITALVARALTPSDEADARPLPFAQKLAQTMRDTANDQGLFAIRFVHLNEDCGPLHPPVLSGTTDRFQMANFFDSDAPARPIRITLPLDPSPAGLRKHARGTAFVMSDLLCGQVQRAKGLGFIDLVLQVLPWPLHKAIKLDNDGATGGCKSNGVDIGMICSLSIPIITICALILLMMIVLVLDFIFRWIPWFIMCFPIPGLKSKPAAGGS